MRWLLDQGLPLRAADLLRSRGEDAIHVSEIGMAKTSDELILDLAAKENAHRRDAGCGLSCHPRSFGGLGTECYQISG